MVSRPVTRESTNLIDNPVAESKPLRQLRALLGELHRSEFDRICPIAQDTSLGPTCILRWQINGSIYVLSRFPAPKEHLSPKEKEIIRHLAEGLTDKEIARKISMSPGTLSTHMRRLRRKLDVTTRSEIVRLSPFFL